jgi:hypothetical protein
VGENLKLLVGGTSHEAASRGLKSMLSTPVVSLLAGLIPWSFFAVLAFRRWRAWDGDARLAVAWTAAGLGFFTAADARHAYYVALATSEGRGVEMESARVELVAVDAVPSVRRRQNPPVDLVGELLDPLA